MYILTSPALQRTSGFVDNFRPDDVTNMTFDGISERVWSITPPMYRRLMDELRQETPALMLTFHVECRR